MFKFIAFIVVVLVAYYFIVESFGKMIMGG